jgi:hypothetical protein
MTSLIIPAEWRFACSKTPVGVVETKEKPPQDPSLKLWPPPTTSQKMSTTLTNPRDSLSILMDRSADPSGKSNSSDFFTREGLSAFR